MIKTRGAIQDAVSLIFPQTCILCGEGLFKQEDCICLACGFKLPKTGFHLNSGNPVAKLFWGRVDVSFAASYLFFQKGNSVQKLLHEFKYRGNKELGVVLGTSYGYELKESGSLTDIDMIVPVPLHKIKLRKRGYNQSEFFARGLGIAMNSIVEPNLLKRVFPSETQTRKSRFVRWKNVETAFDVSSKEIAKDKHVLLVDDVTTTGATLEACTVKLLENGAKKVSVVTLAYTQTN